MHQGYPPDLGQLQAVMNAIEMACSSIQVSLLFVSLLSSECVCNESEIFQEEKWRNDDAGQFSIMILRKLLMGRAQANNIKLKPFSKSNYLRMKV